ncbi:baseplate J/gp47 family protein [Metasolibacillus sp.]|uniref:baseplate J/gp47 family protein n=1 Tax=Metasolibacillus sp. TaxID=2703680 RepID=UPI0025EDA9A4|nr:baseplate J/gp47 family protein [Metasolibacillus sp.]MCT6924110.1 baseplate J/gp47 family protein [Metasolibacillus sp.]MCT6940217.1 baseplate J/gp47 family protein [Metasolibacillus sp.]
MAELNLDTTYEDLMAQKMAGIDNSLDKREGTSMIFNATAANSIETVQMLVTLRNYENMIFADTAPREQLIRRAAERGLHPREATFALRKGEFNIDVPIGSRYSLDELNYTVIERIAFGEFILQCETAGNVGNIFSGQLIPIDFVAGLETATLTDVLVPGEDEEETEAFRTRYFNSFQSVAFGGNRADYKEKVGALPGVGGVRVYRAWNGGGTVKLVIIDAQYQKPSQTLIDQVQEAVDPIGMEGEGVGTAPIDHIVTVFGVEEAIINIGLNITYQTGWTWSDVEESVQVVIDDYFTELSEQWAQAVSKEEDEQGVVIRISQIETRLLGVDGILDIADTTLNGNTTNIELGSEEIPKRGAVSG